MNRERVPLHQWRVYHRDSHFSFKCIFVLFLALQGSDPNWYTALINVLDGEQTRALQDVFVQAEQRKNALGESRGLFQQILSSPARFWLTRERLCVNRVKSLLSMRYMLVGYSFEPRPNWYSGLFCNHRFIDEWMLTLEKPVWREETRLSSREVLATATAKA